MRHLSWIAQFELKELKIQPTLSYGIIFDRDVLVDDTKKFLFLFNVGGDAENTFLKMNEDLYTASFNY